jgi:hypothetical protein
MKKIVTGFIPILIGAFAVCSVAQTPPPPKPVPPTGTPANPPAVAVVTCPTIQIQPAGQQQPVREGTQITVTAVINGGDPNVHPILSWSTSSGVVVGGQGTRNIKVDTAGSGADRQIIADLLIGGYAPECTNQATVTIPVAGPAQKVDEFGELVTTDEGERLDKLVPLLSPHPDRLYIFAYAGRNNVRGYAADAARRLKAYLVKAGIQSERIAAMDGGFREQPGFEFWIVPNGAEFPRPSPTVDRKDIVYPKPTPVKKP